MLADRASWPSCSRRSTACSSAPSACATAPPTPWTTRCRRNRRLTILRARFAVRDGAGRMALSGDFKVGDVSEPNMNQTGGHRSCTPPPARCTTASRGRDVAEGHVRIEAAASGRGGGNDLVRSVTRNLLDTIVARRRTTRWLMSGVRGPAVLAATTERQWLDCVGHDQRQTRTCRWRSACASRLAGRRRDRQPIEMVVPLVSPNAHRPMRDRQLAELNDARRSHLVRPPNAVRCW